MSSKKIDAKGDLNKAGNHWPKRTHPKAYNCFSDMLRKGGLSIDELEANILFCEELAGNFLIGDDERIQEMQDEMRNMSSERLFFIKATFKQFGRLGSGISAVAQMCKSVELPGLHVSLTDKLGFRYSASDEDFDLLTTLYAERLQPIKEIYDEAGFNIPGNSGAYVLHNTEGFFRDEPDDYYERRGGMEKRWCYENKKYDFPSIKPMKARKFYDLDREGAKPPESFENNGIEPA